MIDTKVKINGKTVGEYDLIKEPCVKRVNGKGPDDMTDKETAESSTKRQESVVSK